MEDKILPRLQAISSDYWSKKTDHLEQNRDYWNKHKIERIFYEHQGQKFHPCVGLEFHLFWGGYLFDIRDIKKVYGIETKRASVNDILSLSFQKAFTRKVEEMLKMIGDEPLENVLSELCILPQF